MYSIGRRGAGTVHGLQDELFSGKAYGNGLSTADAEVAAYGLGDIDRREFLKYAGAFVASYAALRGRELGKKLGRAGGIGGGGATLADCGSNNNPASPSSPSRPINVTGRVYDTGEFPNGFSFSNYKLTFSGQAAAVSGGDFSANLMSGTSYRAKIEILDETGQPSANYLGPSELTVSFGDSGNYDFDVLRADGTFRTFLQEVVFQCGSTSNNWTPRVRRWNTQPRFVIDASFPQQFIDAVIRDVINNDVPLVCRGRLYSLRGDDGVIDVRANMPDKRQRLPKGEFYIYYVAQGQSNGEDPGTPNALDNGYAEFGTRWGRAMASSEILQRLGFGNDSTDCPIGIGKSVPTLPTIFDDFVINRNIDRPTEHDIKLGHYVYSREPGTKWPDTRP